MINFQINVFCTILNPYLILKAGLNRVYMYVLFTSTFRTCYNVHGLEYSIHLKLVLFLFFINMMTISDYFCHNPYVDSMTICYKIAYVMFLLIFLKITVMY